MTDDGHTPTRRIAAWLTTAVERHDTAILVATIVLTVLSSLSLLRLRLDVDLVSMLPQGRPEFADYQTFVERFGAQDLAVALVRAPDGASAVRFADAFSEALRGSPEVAAVRSRLDVQAFLAALRDGALPRLLPLEAYPDVERRLAPESIDATVQTLRGVLALPGPTGALVASDPLGLSALLAQSLARSRPDAALAPGQEYLLSPDRTRLIILIRPRTTGYDAEASERLAAALSAAERTAREQTGDAGIEVDYTGAFAYAREDAGLLRRDIMLYTGLSLVGVLAVFLLGYRDLRILPFVTFQMVVATLLAFALGLVLEGRLNAVSLAFAAIFYGLSIDAVIHFYSRFVEERGAGRDVPGAIRESIARLLVPVTIASLTTALAFAVIGFSELAGVAQLGFLTALGMVLNVPATLLLLPASLLWADRHGNLLGPVRTLPRATRLAALTRFVEKRPRAIALIGLAFLAIAALFSIRARFDANLFHLRPSTSKVARVDAELREVFGFTDPSGAAMVLAKDVTPEAREAVLRASESVTDELERHRGEGIVRSIDSPALLMPSRATQEKRLAAWTALPRERAALELERALGEAGFRVEPFAGALGLLRSTPAPVDSTAQVLPGLELLFDRHLSVKDERIAVLTPFSARDTDALALIAERLPAEIEHDRNVDVRVTGRPLMERELDRTMRGEMLGFTAIVLLGSAVILAVSERRLRPVLAILAIPAGSVIGLLGLAGAFGIRLDPVNLIVLPLMIGIGVDNCLFLSERQRELGSAVEGAAQAGRALAIVTWTTVVGFGALAVSRYPALAGLGELAALGLSLCFAATFVFIPVLMPVRAAAKHEESP